MISDNIKNIGLLGCQLFSQSSNYLVRPKNCQKLKNQSTRQTLFEFSDHYRITPNNCLILASRNMKHLMSNTTLVSSNKPVLNQLGYRRSVLN